MVPFQVKIDVVVESTLQIGDLAVGGLETRASFSLSCLTMSVTQPSPKLSQARTSTPRGPSIDHMRHLDGAGVGAGHDADAVIGGNLQALRG